MEYIKKQITKRKLKRKKLANLLLKNYITSFLILFFLLLFSIAIAVTIAIFYFKITITPYFSPNSFFQNNTDRIISTLVKENGGFITVNNNLEVVNRYGKTDMIPDKLTLEMFNNIFKTNNLSELEDKSIESEFKKYIYTTYYNSDNNYLSICIIPSANHTTFNSSKKHINKLSFLFIYLSITTILFLAVLIIYSRATSIHFVKPLKLLKEGANRIASGSYSTRIRINTNNEFGDLRDAFNIMARKIEEETLLKKKSEQARKKLILDISHDLKNPLASILGYSDYLLNTELSKEDRNMYINVINRNASRANDLIQDLFEFSKLDSLDFDLSYKKYDINEYLRSLIASYIPYLEENKTNYYFDIPEEESILDFSPIHLDRAISNLILNAIKYNNKGLNLYIKTYREKNNQIIIIEDNGIGISKSLIENIFDPFVRVDESRNSENGGTGLGLAITKKIIDRHGGKIYLNSDLNKGCTFKIILPVNKIEA